MCIRDRMGEVAQRSQLNLQKQSNLRSLDRHIPCSTPPKESVQDAFWEKEGLMAKDERDILELLQTELDFLEKGGYGRRVSTPWKPTSAFRESLTCVNYA